MQHKVLWMVGLSNGESHKEGKGKFEIIDGAASPWQRLLSYCAENKLEITSLSLVTNDGRRWNLPSAGKNPKFKAFADAPKPIGLNFFRKMAGDVMRTGAQSAEVINQERYAVAEAIYESNAVVQIWVDDESQASWVILA